MQDVDKKARHPHRHLYRQAVFPRRRFSKEIFRSTHSFVSAASLTVVISVRLVSIVVEVQLDQRDPRHVFHHARVAGNPSTGYRRHGYRFRGR
jgi:hypothetical protein